MAWKIRFTPINILCLTGNLPHAYSFVFMVITAKLFVLNNFAIIFYRITNKATVFTKKSWQECYHLPSSQIIRIYIWHSGDGTFPIRIFLCSTILLFCSYFNNIAAIFQIRFYQIYFLLLSKSIGIMVALFLNLKLSILYFCTTDETLPYASSIRVNSSPFFTVPPWRTLQNTPSLGMMQSPIVW